MGISDLKRKYNINDMIKGDVMFCATAITDGDLAVDDIAGVSISVGHWQVALEQAMAKALIVHNEAFVIDSYTLTANQYLGYVDGYVAIITVNALSSYTRQRFSIAHELGHWNYDKGKAQFSCGRSDMKQSSNRKETRANQFAADLLMPKMMFKKYYKGKDINFKTVNMADVKKWEVYYDS